jgi:hypothetical protein
MFAPWSIIEKRFTWSYAGQVVTQWNTVGEDVSKLKLKW